jgi:hypothetical protein
LISPLSISTTSVTKRKNIMRITAFSTKSSDLSHRRISASPQEREANVRAWLDDKGELRKMSAYEALDAALQVARTTDYGLYSPSDGSERKTAPTN